MACGHGRLLVLLESEEAKQLLPMLLKDLLSGKLDQPRLSKDPAACMAAPSL